MKLTIHPDLARELGPDLTRAVLALSARLVVADVAGRPEGGEIRASLDKREVRAVRSIRDHGEAPSSAVVAMAGSCALRLAGLASRDRVEDVVEAISCRPKGGGRPAEAVDDALRIATRAVRTNWPAIQAVAESLAADLRRTNVPVAEIDADLVHCILQQRAGAGVRELATLHGDRP